MEDSGRKGKVNGRAVRSPRGGTPREQVFPFWGRLVSDELPSARDPTAPREIFWGERGGCPITITARCPDGLAVFGPPRMRRGPEYNTSADAPARPHLNCIRRGSARPKPSNTPEYTRKTGKNFA